MSQTQHDYGFWDGVFRAAIAGLFAYPPRPDIEPMSPSEVIESAIETADEAADKCYQPRRSHV